MGILKQTSTKLVLKQVPFDDWISFSALAVSGFIMSAVIQFTEPETGLWAYLLGLAIFAFLALLYFTNDYGDIITWTFDKERELLTVQSKKLSNTEVSEYPFDQISCVMLSEDFGRGGDYQIELALKGNRNACLRLKDRQAMEEAIKSIATFLNIPSKRKKFLGFSDLN